RRLPLLLPLHRPGQPDGQPHLPDDRLRAGARRRGLRVRVVMSAGDPTPPVDDGEGSVDPLTGQVIKGESPWPMAIAVVVLIAFALLSPSRPAIVPPWSFA